MTILQPARAALVLALVCLAVGVPAVESFARPKKSSVVVVPPPPTPPPPPAGPVGLPDRMIADAAAFDGYMRRVVILSPVFTDAGSVSRTLDQARAYSPRSLVRGAVASAAIAALRDKAFIDSIREAGNTPEHRGQMVDYILANPAYVFGFSGSAEAARLARDAVGPAALRLFATGKAIRQSAYDIQKQGWSKVTVPDLQGRLASAEAAAAGDMSPDPDRIQENRQIIAGAASPAAAITPTAPPYTPMVAHALQLAAIAALGEATEGAYDRLAVLLRDDAAEACLGAAKRNFHQCLAVARPNYEDIFCTGQHALSDTGACMAQAAGVDLPPEPVPPQKVPVKKRVRHKKK